MKEEDKKIYNIMAEKESTVNLSMSDYNKLQFELEKLRNELENTNILLGMVSRDRDAFKRMYEIERDALFEAKLQIRALQSDHDNAIDEMNSYKQCDVFA